MDRSLSLLPALGLALASVNVAAQQEAQPDAGRIGVQVFQRSRAGLEFAPALRTGERDAPNPALLELARGNLLRTSVGEQASLTLRLRSGTLSVVWALPLRP